MTRLERLEDEIYNAGIDVWDVPSNSPHLGGRTARIAFVKGNYHIFVRKDLRAKARYCALAHEFGHYHTSFGGVVARTNTDIDYQEARAWDWAFEHILPQQLLFKAMRKCRRCSDSGITIDLVEVAEEMEVTEWFASDAVDYYAGKEDCYSHAEWVCEG